MSNTQINWRVGNKYRRRNGQIVTVKEIKLQGSGYIVFEETTHGSVYYKTGRGNAVGESEWDIIEEVKENEMKIEVGKYYRTRSGHKAFVAFEYNSVNGFTHGGVVYGEQNAFDVGCSWYELGNHIKREINNDFDLIEEWKEPKSGVKYFNIYQDNSGRIWEGGLSDLETVKRWAEEQTRSKTHDALLARVRIEWKEGQFDD